MLKQAGARGIPILLGLLAATAFLPTSARGVTIDGFATLVQDLGPDGKLVDIRYDVSGFTQAAGFGIDILFDPDLYSPDVFVLLQKPAGWDVLMLLPDANLPDDGALDALATVDSALGGIFRVRVKYLGTGLPPDQPFEVFNASFAVVETGVVPVTPEPSTLTLLGLGLLGIGCARSLRRTRRRAIARVQVAGLFALLPLIACGPEMSESGLEPAAAALLAAPAAVATPHVARVPDFTIRYFQVASRRMDRFTFQYDFQATIENTTSKSLSAVATVKNVNPGSTHTQIVAATSTIDFGVVPAGTVVSGPSYGFTISQDRRFPFDPADLMFFVAPTTALGDCREQIFVEEDIVAAKPFCDQAVAADPSSGEARFLRAIVLLALPNEQQAAGPDPTRFTDSVAELEDRFGLGAGSRSLYDFSPQLPRNPAGAVQLPSDAPTGTDSQDFVKGVVLPALDGAIADLEAFPTDDSFILGRGQIVEAETIADRSAFAGNPDSVGISALSIEVDYGDAQALRAALLFLEAKLLISYASDAAIDIDDLSPFDRFIAVQTEILDAHPSLLTPLFARAPDRFEARSVLRAAVTAYLDSSLFIRSEIDDQDDDLLTIEPAALDEEADIRTQLEDLLSAIDGPTQVLDEGTASIDEARAIQALNNALGTTFDSQGAILDLTRFFGGAVAPTSIRAQLPAFDDRNRIVDGSLPDPTFDGALQPVP